MVRQTRSRVRRRDATLEATFSKPQQSHNLRRPVDGPSLAPRVHSPSSAEFLTRRTGVPRTRGRAEKRSEANEATLRNETLKAASLRGGEDCLQKLAQCFPGAQPLRLPALVTALRPGATALRENVIVEFVTQWEALFLSELPLEFTDTVQLEFPEVAGQAKACVVALHYHDSRKAVAVRFETKLSAQFLQR